MILKSFFFAYQQLQLLESFQIQIRFQKKENSTDLQDVWTQMRLLISARLSHSWLAIPWEQVSLITAFELCMAISRFKI